MPPFWWHVRDELRPQSCMNPHVLLCAVAWCAIPFADFHLQLHAAQFGRVVSWGVYALVLPDVDTRFTAVSAGYAHTLAVGSDGTVAAWGWNGGGQCTVPGSLSNVVAIAAGYSHSLALTADGTVVAWGYGGHGETNVGGLTGVVAIAASDAHSLAVKSDGTVVAAGMLLSYSGHGTTETVPSGLSNVIAVAAGYGHSLALKADGTVVSWGVDGATN